MSHFAGLVILTPDYLGNNDLADALAKYDENLEVPEYSRGEVTDYDKIRLIEYYCKNNIKKDVKKLLYENLLAAGKVEPYNEEKDVTIERYYNFVVYENKEEYVALFKKTYPKLFNSFPELYDKNGEAWNDNNWRINYLSGKYEEYSTYNPNSLYDWYDDNGGRWSKCLKTKSGEDVSQCYLNEIDWTDFNPEDYEEEEKTSWNGEKYHDLKDGINWHFTEHGCLPDYLIADGELLKKFDGGWWGMTSNEISDEEWHDKFMDVISRLPENSSCYIVDFHI